MRIGEQKYFWLFGTAPPSIIGDGIDSQFSTIVKTHLSFTVSLGLPTKYVVFNTLFLHLTRELIPAFAHHPTSKKWHNPNPTVRYCICVMKQQLLRGSWVVIYLLIRSERLIARLWIGERIALLFDAAR
jgi:hypothetical protein